jgi:hypothetical protein
VAYSAASALRLSCYGSVTCLFLSFPRYQNGACGDDVSPLAPLVVGVPQGSPISPLCFSLFIDDMTEVLEFTKYHMYADDLQVYQSQPREMLL